MSKVRIDRKARAKLPANPIPYRPVEERLGDFEEAFHLYDLETLKAEASRCILCRAPQPCVEACPLHNDIPLALWLISQGEIVEGVRVFHRTSGFSEICGRVCPQERLCEGACVIGKLREPVHIGLIEATAATYERETVGYPAPPPVEPTGQKVAVVGSGPAGLLVAERLAKLGHSVTVYEAWPYPGGLLVYGIPNFKLDKRIPRHKIRYLEEELGVRFVCNTRICADGNPTLDDLVEEYDAVFLGTGAEIDASMGVPGEDLPGIYHATEYLVKLNLPPDMLPPGMRGKPQVEGRRVAVIGGGDTAIDCLRTSLRLKAREVTCVYRRSEVEMPAGIKDKHLAEEEGARFEYLTLPKRFIPGEDGRVAAMECIRMRLGEPDESGRRRPIPIEGTEFTIDVDLVVIAIGYWPDPTFKKKEPWLECDRWGLIKVDPETGETSREGVYAGGDNVNGPDLVVTALAGARKAADAMAEYLERKRGGVAGADGP